MMMEKEKAVNDQWYGTTKTRWQQPAGSSGRQSSVDTWEHAKLEGKWIGLCRL